MNKSSLIKILISLWLNIYITSQSQNIYTYAGTGTPATSGDGGPAIAADINAPSSVFMDGAGNLYVTDIGNSLLRMVNSSGIINTLAGQGSFLGDGGPASSSNLVIPKGVVLDALGNIYIADANQNRVRKIDGFGIINTIAGTGLASYGGDGGLATSAPIQYPVDVSLDVAGNFYIADAMNNRIRMINTSGTITTIAGTGTAGYSGDGGPATSAQIAFPSGVKTDAAGNIYFTEQNNNCIRKISTSGTISTIAGTGVAGHLGDGGPATSAQLNNPTDLVLDAAGNIFITELPGYVRKISTSGIITTIAGTGVSGYAGDGGPAILSQFNNLHGLALDNSGNIYLADMLNYRIRIICVSSCLAGVNENKIADKLNVYPNPANDKLFLKNASNIEIEKCILVNVQGKEVLTSRNYNGEINVSSLQDGLYFLQLQTKEEFLTKKVIIQH